MRVQAPARSNYHALARHVFREQRGQDLDTWLLEVGRTRSRRDVAAQLVRLTDGIVDPSPTTVAAWHDAALERAGLVPA